MSDMVIRAVGLGKQYRIGARQERYKTLRDTLSDLALAPLRTIRSTRLNHEQANSGDRLWALKDVSFEINRGDVVGIIGPNGAGKTTLLKILSRTTEPTAGYIDIKGRVGSLLEVGTGFHPELTGRENIYLYGAILGMGKGEIDRKFDGIVAFADLEKLLDTPVKHYSVGMQVRLAYAVAAHLEPEILLVDEALAVGDIDFQKKCIGSMESFARGGRTVLFVSHNMGLIESLCSRAILLRHGAVESTGPARKVISDYLISTRSMSSTNLADRPRLPASKAHFTGVAVMDETGAPAGHLAPGQGIRIQVVIWAYQQIQYPWFEIDIRTSLNQLVFRCANREAGYDLPLIEGQNTVECFIPSLNLVPGSYAADISLWDMSWTLHDQATAAVNFDVRQMDVFATGAPLEQYHGIAFYVSQWCSSADDQSDS